MKKVSLAKGSIMKKAFNEDFHKSLRTVVEEIELKSGVEIVVALTPSSGSYREINHWIAAAFSFIIFTLLVFTDLEFGDEALYVLPVFTYLIVYFSINYLPVIKRKWIGKTKMKKVVEIHSRATFQKGELYETRERIGILFFFSFLEREAFIVADRGAIQLVPAAEWERLNKESNEIFTTTNPAAALLTFLKNTAPLFEKTIARLPDDINELPDDIQVL